MKRIIAVLAFVLFAVGVTSAQGIKVGGGLSYANDINSLGLRVDGVYSIN